MASMSRIWPWKKGVVRVKLTVLNCGSRCVPTVQTPLNATVADFLRHVCLTCGVETGSLYDLYLGKCKLDYDRDANATLAELGVRADSELKVSSRKRVKRTNYVIAVVVEYGPKEPREVKVRCPSVSDRATVKTAIQNSEEIGMAIEEQNLAYKDDKGKPIMVKNSKAYPTDCRIVKLTWNSKQQADNSEETEKPKKMQRLKTCTRDDCPSPAKKRKLDNPGYPCSRCEYDYMEVGEASGGGSVTATESELQTKSPAGSAAERDGTVTPTLPEIIYCKYINSKGETEAVKIPEQIGNAYRDLGILLLNDKTGAIIKSLETQCHLDCEQINFEILQRWILGKGMQPVHWDTLIRVMEAVGLSQLAHKVHLHTMSS